MRSFIEAHTTPVRPPLVPEIVLCLATEITPIWQATEDWLQQRNLAPPYWAFAWPGSQALARHVLDHPALVRGKRVLDFAAGCGLAAIACAMVGATKVSAAEIDPLALEATRLNAELNGVEIDAITGDVVGQECEWDVILCGDVCYEAPMTAHIIPWLQLMRRQCEVWIADPDRAYVPTAEHDLATYDVPTSLELEDHTSRRTRLFSLAPR